MRVRSHPLDLVGKTTTRVYKLFHSEIVLEVRYIDYRIVYCIDYDIHETHGP